MKRLLASSKHFHFKGTQAYQQRGRRACVCAKLSITTDGCLLPDLWAGPTKPDNILAG